tara:strand:+ start:73696 stop:73908 length:213 start_codon:yes stop_codon:yes gene_type:complete
MKLSTNKSIKPTKSQSIPEQISFRHSSSVKQAIIELAFEHNMSEADMSRQLVNAGLKAKYAINVRGNEVV